MEESPAPAPTELDQLLAPISKANPVGTDLREDTHSDYYKLKYIRDSLRKQEQENLLEIKSLGKISWQPIVQGAKQILSSKSKDFEVAAWLTEGLLREHGFDGLKQGIVILSGVVDLYWETAYPREDGDFEVSLSPIEGLSGATKAGVLIKPVYMQPIVVTTDEKLITTWDYIQAFDLFVNSSESERSANIEGVLPLTELKELSKRADESMLLAYSDVIKQTKMLVSELSQLINEKTNQQWSYSFSNLEEALSKCLEAIHYLGEFAFADEQLGEYGPQIQKLTKPKNPFEINGLEDVRFALQAIQDFYIKNHPQSPMAYVIRRARDWSSMSLAQLIPQILMDGNSQLEYCRMVGLEPEELQQAQESESYQEEYDQGIPAQEPGYLND